ncbi:uncharacterized protein LOC116427818 isoform X1 [Nomia melanderi]|uniref:uncharacterized protein LOC116427818 isoform X1 n=2 Tax=Nomia melanderi TaxID=2448451 RepID=UPI003FCE686D
MENSSAVTIEGENYEVVDECVEEEDTSNNMQNKITEDSVSADKEIKNIKSPTDTPTNDNAKDDDELLSINNNLKGDESVMIIDEALKKDVEVVDLSSDASPDDSMINNNIENTISNTDNECPKPSNGESIDFTADISLDQLNAEKDVTDADVLQNLDDIENIVLNSSDFQITENIGIENENNTLTPKDKESQETTIVNKNINMEQNRSSDNDNTNISKEIETETSEVNDWYEKKLAEKETIIKERLQKMARIFGISYPSYERWLEWEEKVNGSPLCKLKPARRCCLKKPHTNRWKFICSRKRVQDTTKEMNNDDALDTKNIEIVWKLEPSGAWGVNINNESEFPSFVLRAVKIFEEFLQTTTEHPNNQNGTSENFSDDIPMEVEVKKETNNEYKQDWLWLVVRCNSMDELMLFATGKNISRATMDRLKHTYESGPGKDCNVKSLYCKSTNKCNDTTVTDTTFLVGSEALDEIVGGLKVQLAPKTNFWSNTAGAENVANVVSELLALTPNLTLLEIGCGIGLIGLMMASKCEEVIGVDLPSEVEEAEMTCELNNIKNASFIMGSAAEIPKKLMTIMKGRKACVVINANTHIGRAIEVMTCIRKLTSIKRIVMITTLTKQSVRAILELARPIHPNTYGSPFIPTVACVVDTLPVGPHFEAVILLQRRSVTKLTSTWFHTNMVENIKTPDVKKVQEKINQQNINGTDKKIAAKEAESRATKAVNKLLTKFSTKKTKAPVKKMIQPKNIDNTFVKSKFKGKRPHSPDRGEAPPKKMIKKFGKFNAKPWQTDLSVKKKKEWNTEESQLRINPLYEKKLREYKEQADLRERLSNNRLDTDIAQRVKEHQALLKIAKEKLSGPAPTVDINTAKHLQNMLNMVLEQTNKLQSQLPRSVWDRIAPVESTSEKMEIKQESDSLSKGRYVQEINSQEILITTANKFSDNEASDTKPFYKKYTNIPPLEPNMVMPVGPPIDYRRENQFRISPERYHETNICEQEVQDGSWNRDKTFERNRWNEMTNMRKANSPTRRQTSPIKHRMSPSNRFSPKRPLLSPPRRPCSPPRRHFSPFHRPSSPLYRQRSPLRRPFSPPLRRPMSPSKRISPPRRPLSPRRTSSPRRLDISPMNRPISPLRQQTSSPRRQISPLRITSSSRRQLSPIRRQISTPRRQMLSPNRIISPNRQEMLLSRQQILMQEKQQMSPMRRAESPQRFVFGRPTSPPRRQPSPPRRQMSPQQRFADDWDIPSRGAVEQNIWMRPAGKLSTQNVWRNEKPSTSTNNWDQNSSNDRRRKGFNQEKWDVQESTHDNTWNIGGNAWNSKQTCTKPMPKETWTSNSDNRWSNTSNMAGSSNDNWNIRGKESFNARKESWLENKKQGRWESFNVKDSWKQSDKEDLNDLPEDARDPWGDDGNNLGLKERWLKFENTPSSSTWIRENEQKESWLKSKDNWQNKGLSFPAKPQWQNNGIKNIGESRWTSQNENDKKSSSNWQSGKNVGSWQTQNLNFQPQRSLSTTQFKGFH